MDFSKLTGAELYDDEVIDYIFDEEDAVTREQLKNRLLERAADFGARTEKRVESVLKVAETELKKKMMVAKTHTSYYERYTNFGDKYPDMKCGSWQADMNGVRNPDALPNERLACVHPILPAEIITNVEDGTQKVRLAFCRNGIWKEQIVPKVIIANRSKISDLAGIGVAVTSETAKMLVKFLAEIECRNFDSIPEKRATAKMGWCEDGFMPYRSELTFDKDGRFDSLYDTIKSCGKREKWYGFVKEIRVLDRIEPRLVLAASFASILLKVCGLLPFWVDLWGKTGGGKSVCGMLAASVWADPEIGKYISKFDSSIAAFEARAGFLNNLPFVIDDTAEIRKRLKDDFSGLVYQLASGEGRERSNTKLGLATKTFWKNIIICSGESPIVTDQLQGGAVNRVLEYEVDEGDIFQDGQYAAKLLKDNYGFAGKDFVDIIMKLEAEEVLNLQQKIYKEIQTSDYESKQLLSMSALLTADKIATDYLFKDGIYLTFGDLEKCLVDKNMLSESERCYEYVMNECAVNATRFITGPTGEHIGEIWGKYIVKKDTNESYIAISANVLRRMCTSGGFSVKAFISWADKKGLLWKGNTGTPTRQIAVTFDLKPKCYVIKEPKVTDEEEKDNVEI